MGSLHFLDTHWDHELSESPLNRPPGTFSPSGGEGWDEGVRFMESFRVPFNVHRDHEPTPGPPRRGASFAAPVAGSPPGRGRGGFMGRGELNCIDMLVQAELELGGVGHHSLVPGRLPNELDVYFVNAFDA
jgi:hypothetical protein